MRFTLHHTSLWLQKLSIMVVSVVIEIALDLLLFVWRIFYVSIWWPLYQFQRHPIAEQDVAKAVLQMSEGCPKNYLEALLLLYSNIYKSCSECDLTCQGIVQLLTRALVMHEPKSYEEIEHILEQVTLRLKMNNINDLPITHELLMSLQAKPTSLHKAANEDLPEGTVIWLWGCTVNGGALNSCPYKNTSSAKFKVPHPKLGVLSLSKLMKNASSKSLNQTRINNHKKVGRSQSKRRMTKKGR